MWATLKPQNIWKGKIKVKYRDPDLFRTQSYNVYNVDQAMLIKDHDDRESYLAYADLGVQPVGQKLMYHVIVPLAPGGEPKSTRSSRM